MSDHVAHLQTNIRAVQRNTFPALHGVTADRWSPAKVKFHDRRIALIAAGTHHAIAVTGQRLTGYVHLYLDI